MAYRVKELFHTLQGEGMNAGRSAVFCRFTGCNLWNGREAQRASAICQFCDTDFVGTDGPGGAVFTTARQLADAARELWNGALAPDAEVDAELDAKVANRDAQALIVCTGGEPVLQLDSTLVGAFHDAGFEVALETNGTLELPDGVDWVCVSPKAGSDVVVRQGDELKVVFPQAGMHPDDIDPAVWDFDHFILQPMDGPELPANTASAVEYCRSHPRWRLGLQTHKVLHIP